MAPESGRVPEPGALADCTGPKEPVPVPANRIPASTVARGEWKKVMAALPKVLVLDR